MAVGGRFRGTSGTPPPTVCPGTGGSGSGAAAASSQRVSYTVKRGDTLWGIANTYGVTLTALLNVNPQIKNPNRIAVGERVTLP